jgi:hypothetical protein
MNSTDTYSIDLDTMTAVITNSSITTTNHRTEMDRSSYTVTCREECRDDTDRSAYDMAVMLGQTITMGSVIVYLP